jgi:hypothetical protein
MISEINQHWNNILQYVEDHFGSKPDLNKLLLLIGIRELGEVKEKFEKEEKVQLMHIGGYYVINGKDENGWPNWEKIKDVPYLDVFEQETFLRQHIVEYFLSEEII